MPVSLEHKERVLRHLEGQQALATMREAQALLSALTKPDPRQSVSGIFFRAVACEAGLRDLISTLEKQQ